MKLFKRSIFDDPNTYPLNGTTLLSWFRNNQDQPDSSISLLSAMRSAAVFRSVQILSQGIGTLPLNVFTTKDKKPVTTAIANKSYNMPVTQMELWGLVTEHLATRGNAFVMKNKNSALAITDLEVIHPDRVTVEWVNASNGGQPAIGMPVTKKFTVDGTKFYTNYDIMHVTIMSDDGLRGRGPLQFARTAVAISVSAEQAAQRMYANGLMINGTMSTEAELDEDQAEMLKARWQASNHGIQHAGETAILSHGLKLQPLSLNPADAQFLESRKFQKEEIACLFGLPPWMLGEVERSTGQGPGVSAQFTSFVKLTLRGYACAIEQKISQEILPSTQDCRFDLNDMSRGDSTERAAYYASMITSGIMVPDEVRALEGLGPRPDGKGMELHLPNNVSANNPLQDGGKAPAKKEPTDPGGKDDA